MTNARDELIQQLNDAGVTAIANNDGSLLLRFASGRAFFILHESIWETTEAD